MPNIKQIIKVDNGGGSVVFYGLGEDNLIYVYVLTTKRWRLWGTN